MGKWQLKFSSRVCHTFCPTGSVQIGVPCLIKRRQGHYLQNRCKHQGKKTGADEQKHAPVHFFCLHAPPLKQKDTPKPLKFRLAGFRPLFNLSYSGCPLFVLRRSGGTSRILKRLKKDLKKEKNKEK